MNPLDFILSFLSIVLALALQQVLQGAGSLIRAGRARELPLANYLFALALVAAMVGFWWSMWAWRALSTWSVWVFVLMLIGLTLLYLQAFLVFPRDDDADPNIYYLDSAKTLWGLHLLFLCVAVAVTQLTLDGNPLRGQLLSLLPVAVLAGIASATRRRSLHALVSAVLLAAHIISFAMQPALGG
jgi:hypothetical protein